MLGVQIGFSQKKTSEIFCRLQISKYERFPSIIVMLLDEFMISLAFFSYG